MQDQDPSATYQCAGDTHDIHFIIKPRAAARSKSALVLGSAIAGLLLSSPAYSQTSDQDGASAQDEVVVTAQRRSQSVQDVPASVNVISKQELDAAVVFDTQDLQQVAPSLVVSTGQSEGQGAQIRVRGLGTAGGNPGLEGAVGVYINGIYIPRSGVALNDIVDVERVEVLRGPQGTLFGKNTSAGAILFQTARPEFEFGAGLTAQLGTYDGVDDIDTARLNGYITGPIIEDRLAYRLAGSIQKRDGFVENIATGEDLQDRDRFYLRGSLLYDAPDGNGSAFLAVDYSEKDEKCCGPTPFISSVANNALRSLGVPIVEAPSFSEVALNVSPTNDSEEIGVQAEFKRQFNDVEATVLLGYRDYTFNRMQDTDGTAADIFNVDELEIESEVISGELLLNGQLGGLDWLVGAYVFDESLSEFSDNRFGTQTGDFFAARIPPLAGLFNGAWPADAGEFRLFSQDSDGWSVFTHNVWALTDRLELTGGIRYLEENKSGGGVFDQQNPPACSNAILVRIGFNFSCPVNDFETEFSDSEIVGTLAALYKLNDQVSLYGSYATGFKSGGIAFERTTGGPVVGQPTLTEGSSFLPETVTSYEGGIRTSFADDRIKINATYFHQDVEDLQVNIFDGEKTTIGNLGNVTSKGVELDGDFQLSKAFRLTAGMTYADAQEEGTDVQIPFAPKFVGTISLNYRKRFSPGLVGFGRLGWRYTDDQVLGGDNDPIKTQEGYTLMNGRIGLAFPEKQMRVSLFGTNLLDEEYAFVIGQAVAQPGGFIQFPGLPRMFGVELSKDF